MKSLDEVIEEMQLKSDVNRYYREEHADALHYLKEYRSDMIEWDANRKAWNEVEEDLVNARMKYIARLKELDIGTPNLPLTWDELKGMEGKPVWIEYCKTVMDEMDGHIWVIIHTAYEEDEDGEAEIFCNDMCRLQKKWQGIRWQAYRKERL